MADDGGVVEKDGTAPEQRLHDAETQAGSVDTLRLAVTGAGDVAGGGFQVEVYVNDVELTAAGAGLGMDPYDLLIPVNRLVAEPQPQRVPIARCTCGVYGCGATDVTIVRDGDRVRWDSIEVPMMRTATFAADHYDAEVRRVAADFSWETPDRTAGRLVLERVDREHLLSYGLEPGWVANHFRNPEHFRVALQLADRYQIFIDTPWQNRSPQQLAAEICATLSRPPAQWRASWHAIQRADSSPPPIAGRSWRREQF